MKGACYLLGLIVAGIGLCSGQAADPVLDKVSISTVLGLCIPAPDGLASAKPHGKIGRVQQHADGKVKMEFTVPHGLNYVVEASTNLVDWKAIGVAMETGPGEFKFEDPDATNLPTRFDRIIVP